MFLFKYETVELYGCTSTKQKKRKVFKTIKKKQERRNSAVKLFQGFFLLPHALIYLFNEIMKGFS